jgi:hypothetical protein
LAFTLPDTQNRVPEFEGMQKPNDHQMLLYNESVESERSPEAARERSVDGAEESQIQSNSTIACR